MFKHLRIYRDSNALPHVKALDIIFRVTGTIALFGLIYILIVIFLSL